MEENRCNLPGAEPMFRFTIRDLFWLIVVVAMGVGWWYHSVTLWIGKSMAEDEMRYLNELLAECRQELAEQDAPATLNDP